MNKKYKIFIKQIKIIKWKIVRIFVSQKIFNPWLYTPEGIDFTCEILKRTDKSLSRLSKPSQKGVTRFFYTKPLFDIPVRKIFFRIKNGFWPPSLVVISPTKKCNLSCNGCFSGEKSGTGLSFETVSKIVSEANKMGIYMFMFIGGEPFCWKPLIKIIETFPYSNFSIYTNGTMLDEKITQHFAKLGNVTLIFSIEGFEKETDDRRGSGVWEKVINGMKLCKKEGVRFSYSVTVTRQNSNLVTSDNFVDFLIEQGCFDGWYFQYMPIGNNPDTGLMPAPEQREIRRLRIKSLRKSKDINLYDFYNDGPLIGGCICAGKIYLHINADGNIEPCVFYPFAVDNIKEKSLLEILKSPFFKKIRSYQTKTKNLLNPCPIVDNPQWLRDTVSEFNPKQTQETSLELFKSLKEPLDDYSKKYKKIADKTWEKEYKYD